MTTPRDYLRDKLRYILTVEGGHYDVSQEDIECWMKDYADLRVREFVDWWRQHHCMQDGDLLSKGAEEFLKGKDPCTCDTYAAMANCPRGKKGDCDE